MNDEYFALRQSLVQEAAVYNADVADAVALASVLHQGQFRKSADGSKSPYINHPLRVALRLVSFGVNDPSVVISALLHDVVEDCSARFVDLYLGVNSKELSEQQCRDLLVHYIAAKFGADVARAVSAVSNPVDSDEDKKLLGSLEEQERGSFLRRRYQEHVSASIAEYVMAYLVKLSDWLDNSQGLSELIAAEKNPQRLARHRLQALKYLGLAQIYAQVAHDFSAHVHDPDVFAVIVVSKIHENKKLLLKLAEQE